MQMQGVACNPSATIKSQSSQSLPRNADCRGGVFAVFREDSPARITTVIIFVRIPCAAHPCVYGLCSDVACRVAVYNLPRRGLESAASRLTSASRLISRIAIALRPVPVFCQNYRSRIFFLRDPALVKPNDSLWLGG